MMTVLQRQLSNIIGVAFQEITVREQLIYVKVGRVV